MKGIFASRKFRQGSIATAITVVVVALIVVLNFVATSLTGRYSLTLDLTPGKVFSITDETRQYLTDLQKDVTIYVMDKEESFSSRDEYYLQSAEVLKKYALASPRIQLEFIDLVADPAFAQRYPTLQLSSTSILITSGDKVRDVTPYDLYDIQSNEYGQGYPTASKAEQVLTSAILSVTSDKTYQVAVITGHNEEDITPLTTMLTSNNYITGEVNLTAQQLDPAVYDIAMIAAPQRDFTEDELRQLDAFLNNGEKFGKTLLFFCRSEATDMPNLNAFLTDWGASLKTGMVYESDSSRSMPNNPFMAILDFAEETYSEPAQAAQMLPVTIYARPMERAFDTKNGITASTLLQFSATAGIVQDNEQPTPPDGNAIPYLVMGQSLTYDGTTPLNSQVLTFGSSAFADQAFLNNPNFANGDYLLNLLASFTGREDTVRIQSKTLAGGTLDITGIQAVAIGVLLTVLLPLAVLISGLVIWARRRHR